MNHDSTGTIPSPDEPRAASRRSTGAGAGTGSTGPGTGNGSRPPPGFGLPGAGALLDPLRLDDAMRQLGARLAADPSPLAGAWIELAQSWGELWVYGAARLGRRRGGAGGAAGR